MTFAEYNTDDNYDNKNGFESSLEELVKIGKSEGMTKDAIRSSLSPKWQKSSKLNKFDEYYGEETKPTEEKVTEKVIETSTPKKNETTSKISDKDENFIEQTSSIADTSEDKENERQKELETQRWNSTMDRMKKTGEAFRNIDDHMVEQLPTFMFKRYQNGEFGDPKGSDAKLRLAHFMINGLGTALSNMSHVIRKDGVQEQSDAEKYQQTNLEEGLRNRWNKYKADTQAAIDLAVKEGADEQELQSSVAKISSTNRLNTAFNMMNENQKVYTLRVLSKIGNEIGNMNNKDFVNTLIGFATSGDNLEWQEAAELLIARFGKDALGAIKAADEDGVTKDAEEEKAGIGGTITKTKLSDGTEITTSGKLGGMTDEDYTKLESKATDLIKKYYNGEIDKETFEKDYGSLYKMMKSHPIHDKKETIKSVKDVYKENKPYEAKILFGDKNYKKGLKSVEYFEKNKKLFDYFNSAEEPHFLEAKENGIKDMKEFNAALEHYKRLKDANALKLVGKY
jgi:hypothetical protein